MAFSSSAVSCWTVAGLLGSFMFRAGVYLLDFTIVIPAGQRSLFGSEPISFDGEFRDLRRISLGSDDAWLDHQAGWLSGHQTLFDALASSTDWQSGERQMYDRRVEVPRLVAVLPKHGPGHPILDEMRRALSDRYGEPFVRVSMGLYRDGRDSVAWHGDYVAREMDRSVMASVSIGAPRRLLVRAKAAGPEGGAAVPGGPSLALNLGWGDLLVMGGTVQRTHQHAVPKVSVAQPRIVVMFRPEWGNGY
jgi:alkylated DNA repair dioxygenase AlkB